MSDGVVIHQHIESARPISVSPLTCEPHTGIAGERLRKVCRKLGVSVVETVDGPLVLLADLEAALREHGRPLRRDAKPAKTTEADGDAELLAAAGLRLVGGRR